MDLRSLEIFCKLAENKSFSQTAEELHLSQPTVSFQIRSLEKYYGLKLIERTTRELSLTAQGKILNEYAKKIIALNQQAKEAFAEINGLKRGELVLGASTIPGEYILAKKLKSFQKKFPQIKISLKIADTEEIIEEVLEKKLDLGIVGSKIKHRDLIYNEFIEDELLLITQRETKGRKTKNFTLEDLKSSPLLIREKGSGTRKTMLEALTKENIYLEDLNIVMELGSTEAIKSAVEAGLGISFVSRWAVEEEIKLKKLRILVIPNFSIRRYFYLVYNRKYTFSKITHFFRQFLLKPEFFS